MTVYSVWITQAHFAGETITQGSTISLGIGTGAVLIFFSFRLLKILERRRSLYLALGGEIAVGQELNQLVQKGYWVYHDFPADRFNIDHIVVGSGGVFAVETKARTKQIGTDARKSIERFLGTHVYLALRVRVEEHWSERPEAMKKLGYE